MGREDKPARNQDLLVPLCKALEGWGHMPALGLQPVMEDLKLFFLLKKSKKAKKPKLSLACRRPM